MTSLKTVLKWRWVRALQVWNHTSVRAQGGILALIPIIAVLVSFAVAFYGNRSRASIEYDIQRKFKMVRQFNDLLSLMKDAETGERGYVLTRRPEYLEPYQKAVEQIPLAITDLRALIQLEPGENPRIERLNGLAKVEDLVGKQLASLKESQDYVNTGKTGDDLNAHLKNGKALMDGIRVELGSMQNKEEELLSERIDEINNIRYRDYLFLFIALAVGLLMRLISFHLFDRGIVRRINRLTEHTAAIGRDEKINMPPPKKDDAIGLLEQEIVKIAERRELISESHSNHNGDINGK